jgi:hypothetical protein
MWHQACWSVLGKKLNLGLKWCVCYPRCTNWSLKTQNFIKMEHCTENCNILLLVVCIMYWNEKDNLRMLTGIFQSAKWQAIGWITQVQSLAWSGISLHYCIQTGSGAHPASDSMGIGCCDKVAGEWTDHSPPSSAKDENAWSFTSNPPYIIMAWHLSTGITLQYKE